MSIEAQKQIRENNLELHDFLKDLTDWEHTVKEKEKKVKGSVVKDSKLPPVRGQAQTTLDEENDEEEEGPQVTSSAASHTYDYSHDKWDKFDVDAALKEVDEEVPKKPPPKRAPSTTKTKLTSTKAKLSEAPIKPSAVPASPSTSNYEVGGVRGSGSVASMDSLSNVFGIEEPIPDAMSEKDLGNDFFKEGKYVQAIDCYSRSIALQPTAVAFANRAMASIRIRRYADAELDCTEAISLDDRYTKAYSRRGTARRELKKYLAAVDDFEFALRLEPENKELKKQYLETKEVYEKEAKVKPPHKKVHLLVQETTDALPKSSETKPQKPAVYATTTTADLQQDDAQYSTKTAIGKSQESATASKAAVSPIHIPRTTKTSSQKSALPASSKGAVSLAKGVSQATSSIPETTAALQPGGSQLTASDVLPSPPSDSKVSSPKARAKVEESTKQAKYVDREAAASTQAAAARAAESARAGLARNMVAPKTSYEFETMWKGFGGDRPLQARLLKVIDPSSLPKVFKDSLGAPLLMDMIQALSLLLPDDAGLVVDILENLTRVGRFSMTVMFLTSKDKAGLRHLWGELLANAQVSSKQQEQLESLHAKYRL